MESVNKQFKIYFDGGCRVCSSEIEFYRKKEGAEALNWIDIQSPSFDAKAEGVDPQEIQRVFHVKNEEGQWVKGVDAFIEIWSRIPSLKKWVLWSQLPGAHWLLECGYRVFVRLRPYLPRKAACEDGTCPR